VGARRCVVRSRWRLDWLTLNGALLGNVSRLVLGPGQFFVYAFLATTLTTPRSCGAAVAWLEVTAATILLIVNLLPALRARCDCALAARAAARVRAGVSARRTRARAGRRPPQ
jgi:hypothetical protein